MSTDPFTTAARAEAERRWSRGLLDDGPLPGLRRMDRRIGFDLGAQWGRTHFAAQEPTDAEIEAGARAIHGLSDDAPSWDRMKEGVRDLYREDARAALSASRAARAALAEGGEQR